MQYTEEHYAQLYNDLPEGLKDLVLSGRLAILVSAIGSRHGLNADQIADLEPSVEDVCLGLITLEQLTDNIVKNVGLDQRVANRISAEAELEILKPFGAELLIARKQKEDLDAKISKEGGKRIENTNNKITSAEPKDVSQHSDKKISDWYQKNDASGPETENTKQIPAQSTFDWDTSLSKKDVAASVKEGEKTPTNETSVLENKINELTETINKLVNDRFGGEKKDPLPSKEMQELIKRLEKAEKENEENRKIIRTLQNNPAPQPLNNIFGIQGSIVSSNENTNKIQIDKQRKVNIDHTEPKKPENSGNIVISSVSTEIPIEKQNNTDNKSGAVVNKSFPSTDSLKQNTFSSSVSKDTLDSIVTTRNQPLPNTNSEIQAKKSLSLDDLLKGDDKIKNVNNKNATLVFPGISEEKRVDITDMTQSANVSQVLLDDLDFLKKTESQDQSKASDKKEAPSEPKKIESGGENSSTKSDVPQSDNKSYNISNPFKEELMPTTKEERMKKLQDKIKGLNKGITLGGNTNISSSGLDPYKL